MLKGLLLLLTATIVSCRSAPPLLLIVAAVEPRAAVVAAPLLGAPLARHPELRATVHAPSSLTIDETTLGLNEAAIAVTIANSGRAPRRLGDIRLTFAVLRRGVELSCAPRTSHPDHASDAGTLAPGEAFTATANLGCWTPIAGAYSVKAFVAFDADGPNQGRGDLAGEFPFMIVDPNDRAAKAAPLHPDLFALSGGNAGTAPVGEREPDDRVYSVGIVLVNAGPRALALPALSASLRVYRIGEGLPCAGESFVRPLPALAPGAVYVTHVPATCIRDQPGDYLIVTHVVFDGEDATTGFDIGRVNVRVTSDYGTVPVF